MIRMRMPLVIVLVLAFASSTVFAKDGRHGKHELVIVGSVVGYDELVSLANITSGHSCRFSSSGLRNG